MRLGIISPLTGEMRTLTKRSIPAGTVAYLSRLVLLAHSGIGPQRAYVAGRLLLEYGVNALLSWGCAGALDRRLTPGDLVLPKTVIASNGTMFQVDPGWHQRWYSGLADKLVACTEPLVSNSLILDSPAYKYQLFKRSGAIAVDMESAAIGKLARQAGVPFMVVRVIADTANMAVPRLAIGAIDPTGKMHLRGLLKGLIRYPHEWFALMRLAQGFRKAQVTLKRVASHANTNLFFLITIS